MGKQGSAKRRGTQVWYPFVLLVNPRKEIESIIYAYAPWRLSDKNPQCFNLRHTPASHTISAETGRSLVRKRFGGGAEDIFAAGSKPGLEL